MNRNGYLYPPKSLWLLVMWKLLWPSPTQHSKNSDGLLSIGIWNHLPLNTLQSSLWREKKMLFSIWLLWLRGRSPQFVFLRRGILSAPIFVTTFQKLCASLWYVSSWRTRKNLKTAITANTQVYTQCLHWSVSNLMTFYRFSLKAPAWNTVEFFFFPKLTP